MVYTSTQYDYLYDFAEHEIVKLQNGILSANSDYDSEEDNEEETGKIWSIWIAISVHNLY